MFKKIIPIIEKGRRFVITGHEHADGDALGSQLALYYLLAQMGKTVHAINCDPPQKKFLFVDPQRVVKVHTPGSGLGPFASCDAWFIVDTSALLRIGSLGEVVPQVTCPKVVIDHHTFNPEESFADINCIDDKAVATAILVYKLGRRLGCRIDKRIALALYLSIYTDSGGFVYTKMTPEAHRIVAELMEAGVVPYEVFDSLYQTHPAAEAKLFGRALNSLRFEHNERIAYMTLSSRVYSSAGADPEGSENYLLNYVRAIKTVEVVVLLRQLPDGQVKVSLRSKGRVRIDGVARDLGGGGHWYAAGATIPGSLSRVREKLKALISRELRAHYSRSSQDTSIQL
ncbi:MAG: bifunctional oligoribonuclease/PAP phosphatase NrnA [Candidatus Aureabacteria bacterium]|nr:bifunctional oligoribonuclease/PAP phosphatase NrnA [Candidatus Auribacterota bacterium]